MNIKKNIIFLFFSIIFFSCNSQNNNTFVEKKEHKIPESVNTKKIEKYKFVKSIPTPENFKRIKTDALGNYLRNLELKTENNLVYLYNGKLKYNQDAQFAVIKMDVGKQDLQQCADAVMRLHGEFLFSEKRYSDIHFNFLGDGKARYYTNYAKNDHSHKKFRKYMDYIFAYANTSSLKDELLKVSDINNIKIGEVFIQKGKPYGHAITVMDIAENEEGKKIFMLSQSYMPAQEIHILKNPLNSELSPWYEFSENEEIVTPEWLFYNSDLMRFPNK